MPAAPANAFRPVMGPDGAPCRTGAATHPACPRTSVRLHSGGDCGCVRSPPSSFSELLRRGMTARPSVNLASFRPMNRWRFLPGSDAFRPAGQRPAPGTRRHIRMASPVHTAALSILIAGRHADRRL